MKRERTALRHLEAESRVGDLNGALDILPPEVIVLIGSFLDFRDVFCGVGVASRSLQQIVLGVDSRGLLGEDDLVRRSSGRYVLRILAKSRFHFCVKGEDGQQHQLVECDRLRQLQESFVGMVVDETRFQDIFTMEKYQRVRMRLFGKVLVPESVCCLDQWTVESYDEETPSMWQGRLVLLQDFIELDNQLVENDEEEGEGQEGIFEDEDEDQETVVALIRVRHMFTDVVEEGDIAMTSGKIGIVAMRRDRRRPGEWNMNAPGFFFNCQTGCIETWTDGLSGMTQLVYVRNRPIMLEDDVMMIVTSQSVRRRTQTNKLLFVVNGEFVGEVEIPARRYKGFVDVGMWEGNRFELV